MKYFVFILIFLLIAVSFVAWLLFRRHLKRSFLQMQFFSEFVREHEKSETRILFSGLIINKVINLIATLPPKHSKKMLNWLRAGKWQHIHRVLAKLHQDIAIGFMAHFEPDMALQIIEKQQKHNPLGKTAIFTSAILAAQQANASQLAEKLNLLKKIRLNGFEKAVYLQLKGRLDMYRGDFKPASKNLYKAGCLFRRKKQSMEEAQTWLIIGEIYRYCQYDDAAFMMYDTAQKIYEHINYVSAMARIAALKGAILAKSGQFTQSSSYFYQASVIFKEKGLIAQRIDVLHQMALLSLALGRYVSARRRLDLAKILIEKGNYSDKKAANSEIFTQLSEAKNMQN